MHRFNFEEFREIVCIQLSLLFSSWRSLGRVRPFSQLLEAASLLEVFSTYGRGTPVASHITSRTLDSEFAGLAWQEIRKYSRTRLLDSADQLIEGIAQSNAARSDTRYGHPGIRAQLYDKNYRRLEMDFRIEVCSRLWIYLYYFDRIYIACCLIGNNSHQYMFVFYLQGDADSTHVINMISPGWTCSFSFAEHVVQLVASKMKL